MKKIIYEFGQWQPVNVTLPKGFSKAIIPVHFVKMYDGNNPLSNLAEKLEK